MYNLNYQMEKRWWIVIIIIVVILFIIIFGYYYFQLNVPKDFRECIKKDDIQCMTEISLKYNNYNLCKYISSDSHRMSCIQSIVKDPSFCNKVVYHDKVNCYIYAATYLNDETICKNIENYNPLEIANCYQLVGIAKQDKNICNMINYNNTMLENDAWNQCMLNITLDDKNVTECYKLEKGYYKDQCFFVLAENLKNQTLCLEIQKENDKNVCLKHLNSTNNSSIQ